NRRMRNRMYGGVRGRKTKVGRKLLRFPPTRLLFGILNETFSPFSLHISEIMPYFAASKITIAVHDAAAPSGYFCAHLLTKKSTPLTAHVSGSGNAPEVFAIVNLDSTAQFFCQNTLL
ncbi:MAG: hypothetical protein IKR98_04745, partial [Bacteroidaceae bacterium]|nr:hypothetical protein [Bacteroidaceae bacterium]